MKHGIEQFELSGNFVVHFGACDAMRGLYALYAYDIHIMKFQWNQNKARINKKKHGVDFKEAMSCFFDPWQIAFDDPDHSDYEEREIIIAHSESGRLLLVCYTVRHEVIRLISARLATKNEAFTYEKGI